MKEMRPFTPSTTATRIFGYSYLPWISFARSIILNIFVCGTPPEIKLTVMPNFRTVSTVQSTTASKRETYTRSHTHTSSAGAVWLESRGSDCPGHITESVPAVLTDNSRQLRSLRYGRQSNIWRTYLSTHIHQCEPNPSLFGLVVRH